MCARSESDRRNGRHVFHVPERRTGFDRRRPMWLLGELAANERLFALLIAGIVLMSAADWAFTLISLRFGAVEGNPVLASLLGTDPFLAASFKGAATLFVVWLMWRNRAYRQVVAVSVAGFLLYFALMAYHLGLLAGMGAI